MSRRVYITGLGVVSGFALGAEAAWEGVLAGRSAISGIGAFDASEFGCTVAAEVPEFGIRDHVPKSYRKATKVMARDIELAVVAADLAARDAGLITPGTDADGGGELSHEPGRVGCHIGAGLIAAELDELTAALVEATDGGNAFDIHKWGREGMNHLTPLWLLKYLPNMLACHVTIIHDARGPSNTITCGDASGGLSVGESLRVIRRGAADACFCGGAESKLNPLAYLRQHLSGRLLGSQAAGDDPSAAVRPLDQNAAGMALGEGGGILILEEEEAFERRRSGGGGVAYAEVVGYAASQSVNRDSSEFAPEPDGRGIASAIRSALRDAAIDAEEVDLIVPYGSACPAWDAAEAAALRSLFDDRLEKIPMPSFKTSLGNTGVAAGGIETALAALALHHQKLPPVIHRDHPLPGLSGNAPAKDADLRHALVLSTGVGGQNTALVLRRA